MGTPCPPGIIIGHAVLWEEGRRLVTDSADRNNKRGVIWGLLYLGAQGWDPGYLAV